MTNSHWELIKKNAQEWIYEAGEVIKGSFNRSIQITYKSHIADLVTEMDKMIEQFFIEKIKDVFPEHRVLGEEGFGDPISDTEGVIWIIDPIDGTTNFVHQQSNFAISIGIFENGKGKLAFVYDVVKGELFHAEEGKGLYINDRSMPTLPEAVLKESVIGINATWVTPNRRIDSTVFHPLIKRSRGTRSLGSAALELAYVAAGRLDAYLTMRLSPWDFAAGLLLIQEAGGIITTVEGLPVQLIEQNSIFAAKPGLHQEILKEVILRPSSNENEQ